MARRLRAEPKTLNPLTAADAPSREAISTMRPPRCPGSPESVSKSGDGLGCCAKEGVNSGNRAHANKEARMNHRRRQTALRSLMMVLQVYLLSSTFIFPVVILTCNAFARPRYPTKNGMVANAVRYIHQYDTNTLYS